MGKSQKSSIEVNVVDWKKGGPLEVAIMLNVLDQMLTVSAEGARVLASRLSECADFIDASRSETSPDPEEDSLFGPYEDGETEDEDGETEDEDDI